MTDYILSCSSIVDLPREYLDKRNIKYIYFHYMLDGVQYDDDLGQTMSYEQFYTAMANGADTKTSQVNASEYEDYFTGLLKEGKDLIHISLSSSLSASYRSAVAAAQTLMEQFPDRKIYVVDSLGASTGCGLLVDKLADLRDSGYSIDALYSWVEEHKLEVHYWFYSSDLSYYVKGGRLTKAEGFIGGLLGICPVLTIDAAGKLVPKAKIRTKRKAMREIVDRMALHANGGNAYSGKCFVCHSACYEDAKEVAALVEAEFPNLDGKVLISSIGTTIGSHTGPGSLALFFWGKSRAELL